ncbi:MAG: shikimate dehydrogenase [Thermoleophilaceae bacterium]|jgi:shikimate dehydrogenase|nr:shikimate dehydrogenase [Thermoleophilaceae bacterium]
MTSLAGVLGQPVAHSRSPAMHNAAFRDLGLDWHYVKLPVPPELFEETVRALPGSGYRGANVTIPHKLAALDVADSATPAARAVGAANTLTFADGGGIEADNTDAGGFVAALGEPAAGRRVLVLGAGGAARAVVWALVDAGAAEVSVWNRTPARAEELAAAFGARAAGERPGSVDIVVNTTSVGLHQGDTIEALPLSGLAPQTVVELVYRGDGSATPLAEWAASTGARVVDGLEVLVRQGALSFTRWTGREPSLEVMRAAARGEISSET